MAEYYNKAANEAYKLMIAADLHDIGKLAVSNDIIEKPGKLDEVEFETVMEHPYYTRLSLMEERPYRNAMKHENAYGILRELAENGAIDKQITDDIDEVFGK